MDRVVALIDMDCFYAQVEQRLCPELWGKPVAVIQNGVFRGGGIIALSYEARDRGVKRGMFGDEALRKCPDLHLARVPAGEHADKADLTRYRDASAEVFAVLNNFDERIVVERASVDEAFLDLTRLVDCIIGEDDDVVDRLVDGVDEFFPSTYVATGGDKNEDENYDRRVAVVEWLGTECREDTIQLRLAVGAKIVEAIRKRILEKTQFFCSAGIGANKIIAKMVCARHKPRQQTVIPMQHIREVYKQIPISKVWSFGGKLGDAIATTYGITTMYELSQVPRSELEKDFPGQSEYIFNLARGINHDPVKVKDKQKSIAVSKNFPGRAALRTVSELKKWLLGLIKELAKRLADDQRKNLRTAQSLNCGFVMDGPHGKTLPLNSYFPDLIFNTVWNALKTMNKASDPSLNWEPPVQNVFLSATRFRDGIDTDNHRITQWVYAKVDELEGRVEPGDATEEDEVVFIPDENSVDSFASSPRKTLEALSPSKKSSTAAEDRLPEPGMAPSTSKALTNRPCSSSSTSSRVRSSSSRVEASEDLGFDFSILPPTFEEIDFEYFENMPETVQRRIRHHYQIKLAREADQKKRNASEKTSAKAKTKPTKRQQTSSTATKKTSQATQPPAKLSKISTFFKPS
uniref:DNA polymerase eta n=1 Tax=Steinernema glaseri TaxID=37863 RepID=A0A1I7Y0K4_9BILA